MTPEPMTERFEMRLNQSVLEKVDEWRTRQSDLPSRSEAVRRLVEAAIERAREDRQIKLSDGNKLVILMLCQLLKQMKLKGEFEPEFLEAAICGGHLWSLGWKYTGVFDVDEDEPRVLGEVVDILDMWRALERGFTALSKKEKEGIAAEALPFAKSVKFPGFDGNGEGAHLGVAHFLIEKLDRFTEFKGRELNAHMRTLDAYRRMLVAFEPIQGRLMGRDPDASEIIKVLNEAVHPSMRKSR
jgi:uncharacterized protein